MKVLLILFFSVIMGFVNGFFGGGGGMILVPVLILFVGLPIKKAHATALLYILPLSIISGFFYFRADGFHLWNLVNVGIGVFVGGAIGAFLLKKLSAKWVTIVFSAVMVVAGIFCLQA